MKGLLMPAIEEDFRSALLSLLDEAGRLGFSHVGITAGALHRRVGGYPGAEHRMPSCCAAMRGVMGPSDRIIEQPPSGYGASLLIQFALPRPAGDV
jgi:O-acetyl-ADP-ribose deacetylase (regulator of RNase III)